MNEIMSNLFPITFVGFMVFVFWSMFSKAGKGRMLGGTILSSAKDEIIQKEGISKTTIRAHLIETKTGSKHVGIELSDNAKIAASIRLIKLTKKEAETLIKMIAEISNQT